MAYELENLVAKRCESFAEELGAMSADPHVRQAIMKVAVRDAAWALLDRLEVSKYELADQLHRMADAIKSHETAAPPAKRPARS